MSNSEERELIDKISRIMPCWQYGRSSSGSGGKTRHRPEQTVVTFVILTVAFTSVFWYIVARTPLVAENAGILTSSILAAMWCPAAAAIVTRLIWQRNLAGFGFKIGAIRWWLVGILLPLAVGAVMFGSAWITGIAPFNTEKLTILLSVAARLIILFGIASNVFGAAGEEIGCRLVPEVCPVLNIHSTRAHIRCESGPPGTSRSCSSARTTGPVRYGTRS